MAAKAVSEIDALRRLERKVRRVLQWTWEDDADPDCAHDMEALRYAMDDLQAVRRVLKATKPEPREFICHSCGIRNDPLPTEAWPQRGF